MWLAAVSIFYCDVKADTAHPTNEVGSQRKLIPLICTQASTFQTASSHWLHRTDARHGNRAPVAPFLMLPYNQAQGPSCSPALSDIDGLLRSTSAPHSVVDGASACVLDETILRYFPSLSRLTVVFLHPSIQTLVILHFGTFKLV